MTEYCRTSIGPAAPNNPELGYMSWHTDSSTLVECLSAGLQRHWDLTFPSAMDDGVAKSG